jgi:hypothetical protein
VQATSPAYRERVLDKEYRVNRGRITKLIEILVLIE